MSAVKLSQVTAESERQPTHDDEFFVSNFAVTLPMGLVRKYLGCFLDLDPTRLLIINVLEPLF